MAIEQASGTITALAVGLGGGFVVGIDRERKKGTGSASNLAGVRTFMLVGLTGTLCPIVGLPWLTIVGALLVAVLCAVSYVGRSRTQGITTEAALFLTYILGAIAAAHPRLAAAVFVLVAVILTEKSRLHHFAKQSLSETEIRDGLILAAAALIVYPLIPNTPIPLVAGANPHHLWRLVVLMMTFQALGYGAARLMGEKIGLAVTGLAAGIVSSSATFASTGARARNQPSQVSRCAAAALLSNVASLLLVLVVAAGIHAGAIAEVWPEITAGLAACSVASLLLMRGPGDSASGLLSTRVFSIRQAVGLAILLTILASGVALATERYGTLAAEIAASVVATVDLQAAAGALFSLTAGGALDHSSGRIALLLALSANAGSKVFIGYVAGGRSYGIRIALPLAVSVMAMWGTWAAV